MSRYPSPKLNGGILIRRVIKSLRENGIELPLKKLILTDSGGSDSHALTHLIVTYGRKIVSQENIIVVHINHGWRGEDSERDQKFVEDYCKDKGIKSLSFQLKKPSEEELKNESPENLARIERKKIFSELTKDGGLIFTAHHADDIFETLIWRLCTGKLETHGEGILFKSGNEVRPLLTSKKEELRLFLKEEGQSWCEDYTNHEGLLLRSKMRKELIPKLLEIFPSAVDKSLEEAIKRQKSRTKQEVA